jgi:hypothetical protein
MKFFIKANAEQNETMDYLLKNPLLFAVLFDCSRRARRIKEACRITKLEQGEFFISETETEKFGLKKTQSGILRRCIQNLLSLKIVEKIENKTGNKNCSVYRLIDLSSFMPYFENEEQNREQIENKQRTDREQIETKEERKKEKKEKKKEENLIVSSETEKEIFG